MPGKVNLTQAFSTFDDTWSPRVAADVDGYQVKLVKLDGEFVWHQHEDADELFLVIEGRLTLRFKDRDDVTLDAGELYVVPRAVEHLPVADPGCQVLLLERADVVNTGSAGGDRTQAPRRL